MRTLLFLLAMTLSFPVMAAGKYDNPDTLFVARDGTAEFRNIDDAIEVCRAFMDYHKVIFVKRGIYKEKLIIPSWLDNIEIVGEDVDNTIITYDDHHHHREQFRPSGTSRRPAHRRRPPALHRLPLPGTSRHHLYGESRHAPLFPQLLHRGHHRLHLRTFHRLV